MIKIFIFLFTISATTYAQNSQDPGSRDYAELSFGRSLTGTGDMYGYHYAFIFGHPLNDSFDWIIGLEGTTHDVKDTPFVYENEVGQQIDGTLHQVTSGFQLVSGIRYNFIKNNRHQLGIVGAGLFRYQATSLATSEAILYPIITNLPYPIRIFTNNEPSRTFTVGGSFRILYDYNFKSNYSIGIGGAFQSDTNADTISTVFLRIRRYF